MPANEMAPARLDMVTRRSSGGQTRGRRGYGQVRGVATSQGLAHERVGRREPTQQASATVSVAAKE